MKIARERNPALWLFFALTFAVMLVTWGTMIVMSIPGGSTDPTAPPPSLLGLLLLALGGFSPSIAGIAATWWFGGGSALRDLWQRTIRFDLGWRAYLLIIGFPIIAVCVRLGAYLHSGGAIGQSALLTNPLALLPFTIQIALLGPISEEFGWRGFAVDGLLARWRPLSATLILGVLWAFWHLPLFFIPGTVQARSGNVAREFPVFALVTASSALIYTWLHLRTRRSLWSAILLHFTINFCASFWATLADDGFAGRCIWAALFLTAAIVVALSWRRESDLAALPVH